MERRVVIAVVDDDPWVLASLSRLLREVGYDARTYASARELLDRGDAEEAACFVLDVHLGGMSGFELSDRLRARGISTPIVFISAQDDELARAGAQRLQPGSYLLKPFDAEELFAALDQALGRR